MRGLALAAVVLGWAQEARAQATSPAAGEHARRLLDDDGVFEFGVGEGLAGGVLGQLLDVVRADAAAQGHDPAADDDGQVPDPPPGPVHEVLKWLAHDCAKLYLSTRARMKFPALKDGARVEKELARYAPLLEVA